MLKNWEAVIQAYNSTPHASRATKYLATWGEIFASAYKINPSKASDLWQDLIEENLATTEEFKVVDFYFIKINNAILRVLDIEYAMDLLSFDEKRTKMVIQNMYMARDGLDKAIMCLKIKKGHYDGAMAFLSLIAESERTTAENSSKVATMIESITTRMLGDNQDEEHGWHYEIALSKSDLFEFLLWCSKKYENTLLGLTAQALIVINHGKYDVSRELVIKLLRFFAIRKTHIFFDLLYGRKRHLSNNEITSILLYQQEKSPMAFREYMDSGEIEPKKKKEWFNEIFYSSTELAYKYFEKHGRFICDFDCQYLSKLLDDQLNYYALLLTTSLKRKDSFSSDIVSYISSVTKALNASILRQKLGDDFEDIDCLYDYRKAFNDAGLSFIYLVDREETIYLAGIILFVYDLIASPSSDLKQGIGKLQEYFDELIELGDTNLFEIVDYKINSRDRFAKMKSLMSKNTREQFLNLATVYQNVSESITSLPDMTEVTIKDGDYYAELYRIVFQEAERRGFDGENKIRDNLNPRFGWTKEFVIKKTDDDIDEGGIDLQADVSEESLAEARRTLIANQKKLVVEEIDEDEGIATTETTASNYAEKPAGKFNATEIRVLGILLSSSDPFAELLKLESENILYSVVIQKINEKAMDLYGDILIDDNQDSPSIIEDYRELCLEVISENE